MLAVVDTANENLLIVKIVLRDSTNLDERNYNIYNSLSQDSLWQIARLCSLENFNKSHIGLLGIDNCLLRDDLLDLSKAEVTTAHFSDSVVPSKKELSKRLGF